MKWEIVYAVAVGAVSTGADVKNVVCTAAGKGGCAWSL